MNRDLDLSLICMKIQLLKVAIVAGRSKDSKQRKEDLKWVYWITVVLGIQ